MAGTQPGTVGPQPVGPQAPTGQDQFQELTAILGGLQQQNTVLQQALAQQAESLQQQRLETRAIQEAMGKWAQSVERRERKPGIVDVKAVGKSLTSSRARKTL